MGEESIPQEVSLSTIGDYVNGIDEYFIAGRRPPSVRDNRLILPLGHGGGSRPVAIDLGYAAHTLITGNPFLGGRELLIGLAEHIHRSGGRFAVVREKFNPLGLLLSEAERRLQLTPKKILREINGRLKRLAAAGEPNSAGYEAHRGAMEPLVLFVEFLDWETDPRWLSAVLESGARTGIYLFARSTSAFLLPRLEDERLLLNFQRRITLGETRRELPGRGTLQTRGSQPLPLQLIRGL